MFSFFGKRKEQVYAQHREQGLTLYSQGDKKNAIFEFQKALEAKSDCFDTWFKLGNCYDIMSCQSEAEEAITLRQKSINSLTEAIKLNPTNADVHYMLGNVLWAEDYRKAAVEYECAAKYDNQYEQDLARAKRIISECTYKLRNSKVAVLKSVQAEPDIAMLDYEFYYGGNTIEFVVIYNCVYGSKRQWMNAWLFDTASPNLFNDTPIGELSMSSTGDVSVSDGCPANYYTLLNHLQKNDLL